MRLQDIGFIGLIATIVLMGCAMNGHREWQPGLLGSWINGPTNTELGPVVVKITFSHGSVLEVSHEFLSGPPSVRRGSYRVENGHISSPALYGGDAVKLIHEGSDLILQPSGQHPVRFIPEKSKGTGA